ncbi:MAG: HPr family phosphocarrier protein [Clostridiales bacterium]|nr:HPr family phosphocarrier protein [Clostridiales bacterium]
MVKEKVIIKNPAGLHLRPAGNLSNLAATFTSSITMRRGSRTADAKSLLAILGACVRSGDELEFVCEGEDEEAALAAVIALIRNL